MINKKVNQDGWLFCLYKFITLFWKMDIYSKLHIAELKERILSLRAISKASPLDNVVAVKKDKIQLKDDKIASLREQVKKLEDDKKKLIVQLVDYEELKSENERLKKQLAKK